MNTTIQNQFCNCHTKEKQVCDICQYKPYLVVCPKCHAAATAKCLERVTYGYQFTNTFHKERIELAKQGVKDATKS
jgi:hypothetical protein